MVATKIGNQRLVHMNARVPVTNSIVHALEQFIMLKLTEHGWLSVEEDNENLRDEIIRQLLGFCCAGDSQRVILESLADSGAHVAMARWISTIFLGGNPVPKDRSLLSFTDGVISFFRDLCQDHFVSGLTVSVGAPGAASDGPSAYTQVNLQTGAFHLFRLPAELREMVYREALVAPEGSPVRTFAPPALLRANKLLRNEALSIFYKENHFEITIKRSPEDKALFPSVDNTRVWWRFMHMWDAFNCFGSNCLRHVRHITLIYQLSMIDNFPFGHSEFDRCLGFRFSSDPFDKDHRGTDVRGEPSSPGESSGQGFRPDLTELGAAEAGGLESEEPEGEDSDEDRNGGEDDSEVEQVPEEVEESDPIGVMELNRGTLNFRSRREAHFFLFHKTCEYGIDAMWDVYPIHRLARILWRGARDCPLASENVDLICEDLPHWMDSIGSHTRYKPVDFYDPDDEDD